MTKDELIKLAQGGMDIHSPNDPEYIVCEALIKALAQPEQEPLEYWNAVEGWVKIDEVREHFESVSCGTIYKHEGEGRVPLYTTPLQSEPAIGDIRALKHRIHELEGEVIGYKQILDAQPEQEPVALETVYETIIHWDEGGGKRSRRELARRIVSLYAKEQL